MYLSKVNNFLFGTKKTDVQLLIGFPVSFTYHDIFKIFFRKSAKEKCLLFLIFFSVDLTGY